MVWDNPYIPSRHPNTVSHWNDNIYTSVFNVTVNGVRYEVYFTSMNMREHLWDQESNKKHKTKLRWDAHVILDGKEQECSYVLANDGEPPKQKHAHQAAMNSQKSSH